MRKRYWIIALAQLGAGLFFYFFVYAYEFTGILLCGLSVITLIFGILNTVKRTVFHIIFAVVLSVAMLLAVVTGIRIAVYTDGSEDPEAEYAIVLGAGVNGTIPSVSLSERLAAAEAYLEAYPNAVLILSGGQGENEQISEAQCMYDWLVKRGAEPDRLRIEDQATTTEENIAFSLNLIEAETGTRPETVCIISAEYHLLRASMLAEDAGIEALLYPAETKNILFFCNMFLREIAGIWVHILGI